VKVTGLDLSMTATGVTHQVGAVSCTHVVKSREKRDLRLPDIAGRVTFYAADSDLVLIEGYLNHSHSAGVTGMVHGAVRAALIEAGLSYAVLPPSSLKKFATGKGNASKTDMAVAAFKRGDGVEFQDDNACDSWWLYVAAAQYLGEPVLSMPKAQCEALAAVTREG
jgi:Holliday junction resolvasome RuvABC endonuclease subunit